MKLTELEPQFVRYEMQVDTWTRCIGDASTWNPGDPTETVTGPREHTILRTADADGHYRVPVPFTEAQGIHFLCPLCFTKNAGNKGTHWVNVTFADRGVPDNLGSHDHEGKPVRWTVSGDGADNLTIEIPPAFQHLTLVPSILLIGGCGWHGFITNGEVR